MPGTAHKAVPGISVLGVTIHDPSHILIASATGLNLAGLLIDDHHVLLMRGYLYPLWFYLAIGAFLGVVGIVWFCLARRGDQRPPIADSERFVQWPDALVFTGGLLLALWVVAMQAGGYIIDEEHLDADGSLWHMMWFGGPLALALLVYGLVWRAVRRRALARAAPLRG